MPGPSVSLYSTHIGEVAKIRNTLGSVKVMLDVPDFRTALINLNAVEQNLFANGYPADLIGRLEALSQAIQNFETTVSAIEDGIRGALLYPQQG